MCLDYHLHEYILALWGMPLGEMLDLEKLAQTCREKNRWFFFFSSAPANCPGKSESYTMAHTCSNRCSYRWCELACKWYCNLLEVS